MRNDKKPQAEEKASYERPTLTRHGEFGRVTAGRTGKWSDSGGGRLGL